MGLDMYLYADNYVSRRTNERIGDYEYATNPAFQNVLATLNATHLVNDDDFTGISISIPVGYWRKANAIHAWIVDNCADGVDECQRIYVSKDKAEELVALCKSVISDPSLASDLLPTASGFFFGSTDIDEWYLNDLKRTVQIFEKVLKASERGEVDSVIYQASW
jgi:hypothetical protein